jgi:hypothetical protein
VGAVIADDASLLADVIAVDPHWAHEEFFARRHEDATPGFHSALIAALWDAADRMVILSFRGSGKSTLSEEAVTLWACLERFRNCLLIGSSEARAAERLAAISNELKTNEELRHVFGDLVAEPWTQTKLVLKSGLAVQAMGRDQDIRGIKHLDWRPDLVVVDDFEDKDNVQSPEGRRRTLRWFLAELLPACDPKRRVRVLATPMDQESVPMLLVRTPRPGWPSHTFPIERIDADGIRSPAWPGRYPLTWIDQEQGDYIALGEADVWAREYMCEAVAEGSRTFRPEMIRVAPQEYTFQARFGMIDPARTVRRTSSLTGWAVWSWERHRLVVWEAGAAALMPDEIVDLCFRLANDHQLVELGVEEDGLNEWLLQPIRQRMITEGSIPYRGIRAPRGKIDFIKGLQPFFASGEVIFAKEMLDLRDQLLAFPTGHIDAANALAYSLQLRPGRLIYEDWRAAAHVRPQMLRPGPVYVAANATRTMLSGVLVQLEEGRLRVLADWLFEGDPGETVENLLRAASMRAGRGLIAVLGPEHSNEWNNVGLVQALRSFSVEVRTGGPLDPGRSFIRRELARTHQGEPAFQVGEDAQWTLRAFSGGYCREFVRGEPSGEARPGRYRVLMEGLESMASLVAWGLDEAEEAVNWAYDQQGRRYRSALPGRMNERAQIH